VSCVSEQVGLLQENGGRVSCVLEQVGLLQENGGCVSCVSEQVGLLQENGGCVSCVSEQVGSGSAILSLNVCLHRFHQSHWPKMLLWIGVPSSECE